METRIAYFSWFVLFLVWLPGYFTSKRTSKVPRVPLQIPASVLIFSSFLFLFHPYAFGLGRQITPRDHTVEILGLALDLIGIFVAIWARLALGRNWSGLMMTIKVNHHLVETGPYRIIRHPIYAGFILAMAGTALILGAEGSYVGLILVTLGMVIRVNIEDKLMAQQFGDAHVSYRARTKKLIPFVW